MMELTETYYEKGSDGNYNMVLDPEPNTKYYVKKVDDAGNETFVEKATGESVKEPVAIGEKNVYRPLEDFFVNHICTAVPGLFFLPIHMIAFPILILQIKARLSSINEPKARQGLVLRIVLGSLAYFFVPIGLALFIHYDDFPAALGLILIVIGEIILALYALLMSVFLLRSFPSPSETNEPIVMHKSLDRLRFALSSFGFFIPLVYTIIFPILFHRIRKLMQKKKYGGRVEHVKACRVFGGLGWTIWASQIILVVLFIMGILMGQANDSFTRLVISQNENITLDCRTPNGKGEYWVRYVQEGNYTCSGSNTTFGMDYKIRGELSYDCLYEEAACSIDLLNMTFAPNCTAITNQSVLITCGGAKDGAAYEFGWGLLYFVLGSFFGYNLMFYAPWAITTARWIRSRPLAPPPVASPGSPRT